MNGIRGSIKNHVSSREMERIEGTRESRDELFEPRERGREGM